jgi:DNA-binding MarR family transcriptional regulator
VIDLDSLHVLLSVRARPTAGRIQIHQKRLANELCVKPLVVHRAVRRMEEQGRIIKVAGEGPVPRTFDVVPPLKWIEM